MSKGFLIAFEGIDGTGKSTQLQLLADVLKEMGCPVHVTREPTNGPYGKRIRELYVNRSLCTPEEELELFLLDRRQHVSDFIGPHLDAGHVVLTDRYYYSTAAYQGAAGMNIDEIFLKNDFAPKPDLVILLTLDPEISISRIQGGRGDELNDFAQLDQLRKVAINFASFQDSCIQRVAAARDIQKVQADVRQRVMSAFSNSNYVCSQ